MLFYIALAVGVFFCAFWIAQLIYVKIHSNWTCDHIESDSQDAGVGVSIIHPIKDLDFEVEKNLESWMKQEYKGPVQHIFSFQEPDDPAIHVAKEFMLKYPEMDMEITVNPVMKGINGKSSNMVNGMKLAKYDIVLFCDSDIRVRPDFIVKMVRPLKDEKVGVTTCGQLNRGGKTFWTRFFTYVQNCETDFSWAFLTRLGMDIGTTGAAFAMRKELLKSIGGLEAFGGSLLEDMHLGNALYRKGYKLIVGPFVECYVNRFGKEKAINYARRMGIGIRAHIAVDLPLFILLLFWYWIFIVFGLIFDDMKVVYLCLFFMGVRTVTGLLQRPLSGNGIRLKDIVMPLFYDVFGTYFLLFAPYRPFVTWRGIRYEVKNGGFIEGAVKEETIETSEKESRV